MIELLMAAFVMAIGILGLTMLQLFAIKGQTGAGSQTVATSVAERILEQAEMAGRNSLICSRFSQAIPALNPNYFASGTPNLSYYTNTGAVLPNPTGAYFTATATAVTANGAGNPGVAAPITGLGGAAQITVVVTWTESVRGASTTSRSVTISRLVNYATS
jgi:Tfp pilus assembly protein PilV